MISVLKWPPKHFESVGLLPFFIRLCLSLPLFLLGLGCWLGRLLWFGLISFVVILKHLVSYYLGKSSNVSHVVLWHHLWLQNIFLQSLSDSESSVVDWVALFFFETNRWLLIAELLCIHILTFQDFVQIDDLNIRLWQFFFHLVVKLRHFLIKELWDGLFTILTTQLSISAVRTASEERQLRQNIHLRLAL